jgi:3-oxoacyl-[acyl-carrier-protein] synthase-3
VNVYLRGVAYHLPDGTLSNDDLVRLNPTWDAAAIFRKTGIRSRRVAAPSETSTDLACRAAEKLLAEVACPREQIDALLFCTQTPDDLVPASACLLQLRLGLPRTCAAFDFHLGSSGFTYGLWLAGSLIRGGGATNVLLLAADTLSKQCDPHDLATVTLFGDGAGAALITRDGSAALARLGPTVLGTDGRGAEHLIIPGGARRPEASQRVRMNGPEVFNFTLSAVPDGIARLLAAASLGWSDVDVFLLHQANGFILETLRRRLNLPAEKCPIDLEEIGNTWSASLPILLRRCLDRGAVRPGQRCVLAGYGVGYSWAMTDLTLLVPGQGR